MAVDLHCCGGGGSFGGGANRTPSRCITHSITIHTQNAMPTTSQPVSGPGVLAALRSKYRSKDMTKMLPKIRAAWSEWLPITWVSLLINPLIGYFIFGHRSLALVLIAAMVVPPITISMMLATLMFKSCVMPAPPAGDGDVEIPFSSGAGQASDRAPGEEVSHGA